MRRSVVLLSAMLGAAVGCSGGASTPSISDPTPGDAKMATVTFRAGWPTPSGKSLVDWNDTSEVYIEVWNDDGYGDSCSLYPPDPENPQEPVCTFVLPIGDYYFAAARYDWTGSGDPVEVAGTAGKVIAGQNAVVVSFLNGDWTLDEPIDFSDGTQLRGFRLAFDQNQYGFGPMAFEPNLPTLDNAYMVSYAFADGFGNARLRHYTQFGGGALNRSALDGGGFSLTSDCGESDGPDSYPGACTEDAGPGSGELWIRMIADTGDDRCGMDCSEGDRAVSRLLPRQSFEPDIGPIADATVVDGSHISGTFIEYEFDSFDSALVEVGSPYVPPPPSGESVVPGLPFTISVTEYRMVVFCQDGLNGNDTIPGEVETGQWSFDGCGSSSDGQGGIYYECGWLQPGGYSGECNLGLVPLDENDLGEWCDGAWYGSCDTTTADGVPLPNEFVDMNWDGQVDTGSFFVSRFLLQTFDVSGTSYPFTATGVPSANGTSITFQ